MKGLEYFQYGMIILHGLDLDNFHQSVSKMPSIIMYDHVTKDQREQCNNHLLLLL